VKPADKPEPAETKPATGGFSGGFTPLKEEPATDESIKTEGGFDSLAGDDTGADETEEQPADEEAASEESATEEEAPATESSSGGFEGL
jgi:hypothetical protein